MEAKEHCCQESSMHTPGVPCNKPATMMVGFPSGEGPYRMCDECAHHNVNNRSGSFEGDYTAKPIGHNNPPETIRDRLRLERKELFDRIDELKASCDKAPSSIADEETAKRVSDLLKMVRKALSSADEARKIEQQPWEQRLAETRATFNVPMQALKDARVRVKEAHDAYLQRKKDEAKRKAEEEAKKQREEAERQQKAAEEAERARVKAEREAEEAREAARKAQREREEAQAEARKAREELAQAKADEERREAERKKREADSIAEEKRKARELEQKKADLAEQEKKDADREAKAKIDEAVRSEDRADKQDKLAGGKAADLGRVRSDYGAVSSLSTRTVAEIVNYEKLPRGILWGFISKDAIDVAVNKALKAGYTERELPGVRVVTLEEGRTV